MVIMYLPQQANTCSKSATKTLEITENDSNENLFKKQPQDVLMFKQPHEWFKRVKYNYCNFWVNHFIKYCVVELNFQKNLLLKSV